jgi:hypothetical protein
MARSFEQDSARAAQHGRRLAGIASILEVGALILGVVGVVAGILVIVQGGGDAIIGAGLGAIVAAVAIGVTLWVQARALRLVGEYVAVRLKSTEVMHPEATDVPLARETLSH